MIEINGMLPSAIGRVLSIKKLRGTGTTIRCHSAGICTEMNNTQPARVEIGDSVLYQTLQNEIVLLNIATQRYYGLNAVGARMWELLIELRDVSSVAERLEANYEVDSAGLRADLEHLIGDLLRNGLLKAA
jgi:hypothetical protein